MYLKMPKIELSILFYLVFFLLFFLQGNFVLYYFLKDLCDLRPNDK